MAEKHIRDALPDDTTVEEAPAAPEQQESAPPSTRHRQQKRKNGANDAAPKKTRAKKRPALPRSPALLDTTTTDKASPALERENEVEAPAFPVEIHPQPAPEQPAGQPISSVDTLICIPETPLHPAIDMVNIPETPLPTVVEEDAPAQVAVPAEDESVWEKLVIEEEVEVIVIAAVETRPAVEPEQPAPPARPRLRPRPLKRVAMLLAFILFIASSLLWWQNISETHLYLYRIDPGNGQIQAQQDLGGYASIAALSNAAQDQSSLFLGLSTAPSDRQQVLSLAGSVTSWHVTRQFATSPGRATLSAGPGHVLAVESGSGLQVMSDNGQTLWQAAGDAPLLGAHAFTPAFYSSTVYTVQSARRGIVAAYDVRNGSPRWTVRLDDTLNYTPPVLLIGDTLYVAGDHTLYALNAVTGGTRWKTAMPARTLLYSQANTPALIAVGASGLAACDLQSGALLWSFNGRPDASGAIGDGSALTTAQFYQADLLTASNTIYATGLVWDTQRVQQQLWLFAIDAGSGKPIWSEQIGAGFTNADGGRVFAPFLDAAHKLIVIEQAQGDGSHTLSAFDTGDGFQRWNVRMAAVTASSPDLVRLAGGSLGVFSAQSGAGLAMQSASGLRALLLLLAAAGLLLLLLLWVFPLKSWLSNTGSRLRKVPHTPIALLRAPRRLWRFSRPVFALILAAVLVCAGTLTYTQLNQQHPYVRQVGASSGNGLWQHMASSTTTLAGVDSAGALLSTGTADHTVELTALDSGGSPMWTLSAGEGTFSVAPVATQAGAVLAVLHGPSSLPYHYAPEDPAYANPLAHYFALYQLDSHTGQVLWHNAPVEAGALQDATVLGADSQFIYVASRSLQHNQVVQLIAVDRTDGNTAWRFYGPREVAGAAPDFGAVLARGSLTYWQVDNAIYALNPLTGQVEWRDVIPEANAQAALLEEGQMATGQGVLLVRRSDMYHALDLVTGAERWTLSGLGVDNAQAPGGILTDGNRFILYGHGSIEAVDATTRAVLWNHDKLAAVSNVSLSPDGSVVYAVVFNQVADGTNTQALVAFDANTNLIRWTFQPGAQAQLVYAGARIIYSARGMIYLATCVASKPGPCNSQVLYGLDESTGAARWQIEARRVYELQASQDDSTLIFQTNSSAWEHLKAIFQG